jgi:hypothetical protein
MVKASAQFIVLWLIDVLNLLIFLLLAEPAIVMKIQLQLEQV